MKQFNAFASKFRINTLLFCSAAVLLSACGGNTDAASEQLSATAASVATDAGAPAVASTNAPAVAVEAIAEAAPAANNEAAPAAGNAAAPAARTEAVASAGTDAAGTARTSGATAQAAPVSTQEFELTGYDSHSLQAQADQQNASATALAPIKQ